jgi:hypothetical protein
MSKVLAAPPKPVKSMPSTINPTEALLGSTNCERAPMPRIWKNRPRDAPVAKFTFGAVLRTASR